LLLLLPLLLLLLLLLPLLLLLLKQVLPALLAALRDPEGEVRGAAAFALGQFSEHLQPDITHHHQQVLPGVFRLLQDPNTEVQERACYGEGAARPWLWAQAATLMQPGSWHSRSACVGGEGLQAHRTCLLRACLLL
jgi:hypothetical protein